MSDHRKRCRLKIEQSRLAVTEGECVQNKSKCDASSCAGSFRHFLAKMPPPSRREAWLRLKFPRMEANHKWGFPYKEKHSNRGIRLKFLQHYPENWKRTCPPTSGVFPSYGKASPLDTHRVLKDSLILRESN